MSEGIKMKKSLLLAIFVSIFALPQAFSQSLPDKPALLELTKYSSVSGDLDFVYVTSSPRRRIRIDFTTPETKNFRKQLLEADVEKLSCEADFSFMFDMRGQPVYLVKSIKVCVNEENFVVAHSIGMPLQSADTIQKTAHSIEAIHAAAKPSIAINNSAAAPKPAAPAEPVASPLAGVVNIPKTVEK
jgi:hypothetical protein